ncbi:MAG: AEC family transporter [Ignavibacteriaceae bacterium]
MQNLILILGLVCPVFLIIALGYFLKRLGTINDNFIRLSTKIVFNISLPALIFTEVSKVPLDKVFDIKMVAFVYSGILISFIIIWVISIPLLKDGKDRGVFIQGSFRSNYAIIGLALISNIFGSEKLGKASLLLAFIIPLFNILSVIALMVPNRKEKQLNTSKTLLEIIKNPLIIAVMLAVPFSYYKWELPGVLLTTVDYLAALSLPLALIGIGGFINFQDIRKASFNAILSTTIKLVIIPLTACIIAYELNFPAGDMGIIFIFFGCPTAIVSFIMAEAMGSNSRLAGNIVLMTTLGSIITITAGLFILKQNGLL